jgi:Alpha galactosidase A
MYIFFLYPPFYHRILTTLQDCWALLDRDPITNEQVPDPLRFSNGIKALADRIHSMGLKIGIYGQMFLTIQVL